ncbi:MAG: peptidoglycan DD-metalloendopeptidase family protein [SAR324 cluster bacterium]|nr:peptidoglycan DD-metalloendopeptidase family protein [SAR324 cluster bacterium]
MMRPVPIELAPRAKVRRGLVACGAFLLMLCLAFHPAFAQKSEEAVRKAILEKKNQIKQLQFEKRQVVRRLKESQQSEAKTLRSINTLSGQIRAAIRRERDLRNRKARQTKISKRQQAEISRLAKLIAGNRERADLHLKRIYRLSKLGDSATLLALARHKQFFKDSRYLALVIRFDMKIIEEFQEMTRNIKRREKEVQSTLARLASLNEELRRERKDLHRGRKALRKNLQAMRDDRKLYNGYLEELKSLSKGMETAVLKLEEQARNRGKTAAFSNPRSLQGQLPPPSEGSLVASFGRQDPRYKLKKFQRGIVIRVPEAAAVHAVAPGRVVHAGPFRGYQELVVLDHGKGLFTVYGHLEELRVERGSFIAAGSPLGAATFQPVNNVYDLYFEIRLKGKPVDPLKWLKPGSFKPYSDNGGF